MRRIIVGVLLASIVAGSVSLAATTPAAATNAPAPLVIPKSAFARKRDPFFPNRKFESQVAETKPDVAPPKDPVAAVFDRLVLRGLNPASALISSTEKDSKAVVFAVGETRDDHDLVKLGTNTVSIKCLEIQNESVLLSINGSTPRTLTWPKKREQPPKPR